MAIKRAFIIDTISVLILITIWILFNFNFFVDNPVNRRGWFRGDLSISLPNVGSGTIPTIPLTIFAFIMPLVALILTWIFVDKIFCNHWEYNDIERSNDYELLTSTPTIEQTYEQRTNPLNQTLLPLSNSIPTAPRHYIKKFIKNPRNWAHYYDNSTKIVSRKVRFAIYQLFILIICCIFCILVTTSLKWTVGRLRPDFLDRCKPDYNHPDLVIGENGWIDQKYEFICQGEEKAVSGGRESFPSGHSSSSLTASTFTSILLWQRCFNRGLRTLGFIVIPFLIMCVFCGGLLIATSRSWDNRHHFFDIFFGCGIGILSGSLSLLFPHSFTPTWECDGTLTKNEPSEPSQNTSSSTTLSPIQIPNQDLEMIRLQTEPNQTHPFAPLDELSP